VVIGVAFPIQAMSCDDGDLGDFRSASQTTKLLQQEKLPDFPT
jgi:hypothetical protein